MKKLRVLRKHTVGRPELLWNIRRGSSEEVTFEPDSEEGGRANRMGARRREVGKEDADREWINMLQGEGKEHGVTEGKGQREAVFLGRAESQTWRCRSRSTCFSCALGTHHWPVASSFVFLLGIWRDWLCCHLPPVALPDCPSPGAMKSFLLSSAPLPPQPSVCKSIVSTQLWVLMDSVGVIYLCVVNAWCRIWLQVLVEGT